VGFDNSSAKDVAASLGRSRANPLVYFFVGIIIIGLIGYVLITRIIFEDKMDGASLLLAKTSLIEIDQTRAYYSEWLRDRVSESMSQSYDQLAEALLTSAQILPPTGDIVYRGWVGLHKGVLRILFIVMCWWKFWLLGVLFFGLWSVRSYRVWFGRDILGKQTNGRLFYSGIRADLRKISKQGAPDVLTPGLACAKMVELTEARSSQIGKILALHKVANTTNLKLAATILAYPSWPAFIAARGESELLERAYAGAKIKEHAALVLEAALSLVDTYREYAEQIEALDEDEDGHHEINKLTPTEYVQELKFAFNRVLPSGWKRAIAKMNKAELAAIVLANEASKVMAYKDEGARMVRGSVFPQLCARSIIHSIPDFSDDFDFDQRGNIRQAIIYGSRKSVFGPVKFLIDLPDQTRAARQWMELLMACPHELVEASDEVELYGLVCTMHDDWSKELFDDLMISSPEKLAEIITHSTMMYLPFKRMMGYFRKTLDAKRLKRLHELAIRVSDRQQLAIAEGLATGVQKVPDYLRIFAPIPESEVNKIAKTHSLNVQDLKDWSALRLVLNYYSWLGRRVGDSTVPDSSIIFLAARRQKYDSEMPTLTSECHTGMVALRATRLIDRWGPPWSKKFDSVMAVTAVDDMEEFEKFKRGESLDGDETPNPDGASAI
jgi:hypothetical protein